MQHARHLLEIGPTIANLLHDCTPGFAKRVRAEYYEAMVALTGVRRA